MLKRGNWFAILGAFFVLIGALFLLTGQWIEGAWAITLGGGNLFSAYGRRHPEINQKRSVWPLVIGWCVVLAIFTILKLTRT
jgi:hypothetical protein